MTAEADVLVVEDDPDISSMLVEVLDLEGYRTATAANGREALNLLHAGLRPRLILLDLMMPELNGWQFRAAQLEDPRLAEIPVVVLSANVAAAQRGDGLAQVPGLRKPVDVAELVATVDRYRSA
jgi:two-component system response regulator MprA